MTEGCLITIVKKLELYSDHNYYYNIITVLSAYIFFELS